MCCHRNYECFVQGKWTFSDPWGDPQSLVKPWKRLSSLSVTEIVHGTHKENSTDILATGFEAQQHKIEPNTHNYTWSGKDDEWPREVRRAVYFPGYYVWFAPKVSPTKVQRETCWKMITKNGVTKFADYIVDHSRYGSQAFSLSLSDAIQLYEYSLKKYYEESGQRVSNLQIVFKKPGTKRYQRYVGYILVISAKVDGSDLLPGFQNVVPERDNGPITVLNNFELLFRPRGIAIKQGDEWCSWDQVEIAFHFPSLTPHSRPVLFTQTQSKNRPYFIKLPNGYTVTMLLSRIHHTFCVHNKECPEKNDEKELEEHQERKFKWS